MKEQINEEINGKRERVDKRGVGGDDFQLCKIALLTFSLKSHSRTIRLERCELSLYLEQKCRK
jgi:hypothetical protein